MNQFEVSLTKSTRKVLKFLLEVLFPNKKDKVRLIIALAAEDSNSHF